MNFLDEIFDRLTTMGVEPVLAEMHESAPVETSARTLLAEVAQARAFLREEGIKPGDRCVLLAANSVRRIAVDLAIMSEGATVVPLYARQAAVELATMIADCTPVLICCGDAGLSEGVAQAWTAAEHLPRRVTLEEMFEGPPTRGDSETAPVAVEPAMARQENDPVTILYTSGTSGTAKGVVLTAGNVGFMLGCTSGRLDLLMQIMRRRDRVFHYLPLNFAGSWIMMLTCLRRGSQLILNMDLAQLAHDIPRSGADYFLNVPQLLDRMRKGVDELMSRRGGLALRAYRRGRQAWLRQRAKRGDLTDYLWVSLTQFVVFPMIRRTLFGNQIRALICGSAPLAEDTQLYYQMLGVPVLQVYGLTETTAICTMDDPREGGRNVEPGRVGPAIPGIEMKLGENDEILMRGPNIFVGYWNRPEETAKVLRTEGEPSDAGAWFYSGDQGEVDRRGNWKITGRIKNLIILGSGHNIAPEPIEDRVLAELPSAQQVVLIGNGRSYLSLLVTGSVSDEDVERALTTVNKEMPHYRQIRRVHVVAEVFSIENGLLTANGKIKRDAIAARYAEAIAAMYPSLVTVTA